MLFDSVIYGPIHSRRLGTSLGINLSPTNQKLCSFNCVYCECGWNTPLKNAHIPTIEDFMQLLEKKLIELKNNGIKPDVITFSGNGEPTMHPEFESIIAHTCRLRDKYAQSAKVSVLSNSTQLHKESVRRALLMADNRILKLDSAINQTMQLIDQPTNKQLTVKQIINWLEAFNGDFTLQTCFLKGSIDGQIIDNTTDIELQAWYEAVRLLRPENIMIYVIDRQTPCPTLEKITPKKMHQIAQVLIDEGFSVSVSA